MSSTIDLSQLVQAVGDAIVVTDAGGAITLWNPAAERMFGFPQCEALGRSLDLIIPERLRGRHWDGFHKTMLTGHTKYGTDLLRVPAVDKGGRTLSLQRRAQPAQAPGRTRSTAGRAQRGVSAVNPPHSDRRRRPHSTAACRQALVGLSSSRSASGVPTCPAPNTTCSSGSTGFAALDQFLGARISSRRAA
jgi:PAS domain S-box-containing protein